MTRKALVLAGAFPIALATSSLLAQQSAELTPGLAADLATESDSFGLGNQDYFVSAEEFVPIAGQDWFLHSNGYRRAPNGASLSAPLHLPAGAVIAAISCYFYDAGANESGSVYLLKMSYDQSTQTPTGQQIGPFISSMDTGGYHVATENFNETIRYREGLSLRNYYLLGASMPPSLVVELRGCRVVWHRQVSAGPGSATFTDVPTNHPYFQFVEALVDSGITAGCGGGNYCVNTPITRGEMAVFLATALGLHFPN